MASCANFNALYIMGHYGRLEELMAKDAKRQAKTQSLSLRLDPKTRFVLEFVARIKGQSITAVVERAIKETADNVGIGGNNFGEGGRNWADFWDANDGVRILKLIADSDYPTSYDEDEIRAFTLAHRQFFYTNSSGTSPRRSFIEILWPSIDSYLEIWREKKSEDYWAAGEAMKKDISAARVATPDWPPKAEPKAPRDLDDEIPF